MICKDWRNVNNYSFKEAGGRPSGPSVKDCFSSSIRRKLFSRRHRMREKRQIYAECISLPSQDCIEASLEVKLVVTCEIRLFFQYVDKPI